MSDPLVNLMAHPIPVLIRTRWTFDQYEYYVAALRKRFAAWKERCEQR